MSTEVERATPADAGCWVSGANHGWRGSSRVVEIACAHGFTLTPDDSRAIEAYDASVMDVTLEDGSVTDVTGYVIDQGGLHDDAVSWLNDNVAPDGYLFGWHDGDFMLWSDMSWCEAYGDSCQCDEPHAEEGQ